MRSSQSSFDRIRGSIDGLPKLKATQGRVNSITSQPRSNLIMHSQPTDDISSNHYQTMQNLQQLPYQKNDLGLEYKYSSARLLKEGVRPDGKNS